MKLIEHDALKKTCKRIDSPSGRKYQTPDGNEYPSVTSIISIMGEEFIRAWKEAVGEATANEISRKAATRGTLIHENCENYLQGKPLTFSMFEQEERKMFENLMPVMESIEEVHAMESMLYSDTLKFAGTVDLIAKINGELCILDWKTSGRYKSSEDIPNYFTQAAAYAYAFWEMTGITVPNIVIAMTTEEFGLLLFKEPVIKWIPEFVEIRKEYARQRGC
jgi:genome maintenance exonuclease 1